MSDYEDDESVSSEGDVGEDSANGGGEEASDRDYDRAGSAGGEEELEVSGSEQDVAAESVSEKVKGRFAERSVSGSDASVGGEDGRNNAGNDENEFDEEIVPDNSGFNREVKEESGEISREESHGSDFEEGIELATNRQEAFSDGDSHSEQDEYDAPTSKALEDTEGLEEVEGVTVEEDVDDLKDVSEPDPEDKVSDDEDYQVISKALTSARIKYFFLHSLGFICDIYKDTLIGLEHYFLISHWFY